MKQLYLFILIALTSFFSYSQDVSINVANSGKTINQSNTNLQTIGWEATARSFLPCQVINATIDSTNPAVNASGEVEANPNENIIFNGSATFSTSGTGATYIWNFGNGDTLSGETVSYPFSNPGTYTVTLTVQDNNPDGCSDTDTITVIIQDNNLCIASLPICSAISNVPSATGNSDAQVGINYGCLRRQPNPRWYFLQNGDTLGDLNFTLTQTSEPDGGGRGIDVDFIIWGPFDSPKCSSADLNPSNQVDCSYSGSATEVIDVPDAPANATYVILITNFAGDPGFINLELNAGSTANTNCDIICEVDLGADQNVCSGSSYEIVPSFTGNFDTYEWLLNGTPIAGETGPTLTVTEAGTYTLNVSGVDALLGEPCSTQDEIEVRFENGFSMNPTSIQECAATSSFNFNLEDAINNALTPLNAADYTISFYTNPADANVPQNPIPDPTMFSGTDGQVIIIRALDNTTMCANTSEITLELTNSGVLNPSPDIEECDSLPNDGVALFTLTDRDISVLGGQDPADYNISYYTSLTNATAGTSPLVSPYENTESPQPIYVRIENVNDATCFEVSPRPHFNLIVNPVDDASFTVTPFCGAGTVTITGDLGGTFSFDPVPTDGAVINTSTGEVSGGSINTTYTILYTTPGSCPVTTTQSFTTLGADDATFSLTPTCDGATANITGVTGGTFTFNPIPTDGAILNAVTGTITNAPFGGEYTVQYTTTSGVCSNATTETVTVFPEPIVIAPTPLVVCDELDANNYQANDGFYSFDLTEKNDEITAGNTNLEVSYYLLEANAETATSDIADVTMFTNTIADAQNIWVRVEDINTGCYVLTTLDIRVLANPTPRENPMDLELCSDVSSPDGIAVFDLTQNEVFILNGATNVNLTYYTNEDDALQGINPIADPTIHSNEDPMNSGTGIPQQSIYVRMTNGSDVMGTGGTGCYTLVNFDIIVNSLPAFDLTDSYFICENKNGTEVIFDNIIDTGLLLADYTFQWYFNNTIIPGETQASLTPQTIGVYSVIVTDRITGCSNSLNDVNAVTSVEISSPPIITAVVATDAFSESHIIEVTATGEGAANFEFSLDGGAFVSNEPNTGTYSFTDVSFGEHIITVRDKNGCGLATQTVMVMDYPLFFTPNQDGFNDSWNISGIAEQPDAKIYIFDRMGKLLKQISPIGNGWDGTYNNNPMPTGDYWFTVEYKAPNTNEQKSFKAHFTLKR